MRFVKQQGFVCVLLLMSVFTSCLQEINSVYNPGVTVGVVRQHGDSAYMMATTRFGWIYDKKLSSYSGGKCLLLNFQYDPNLPENEDAQQKGYYTVEISGESPVPQHMAESGLIPTGHLLENEQPILAAMNMNDSVLFQKLDDFLFLPSICQTTDGRALVWRLAYDPAQLPVVENRQSIYSLYLRVSATTGKPVGKEEIAVAALNAFDLSAFIQNIREQEGREGDMYIRIHYIDRINPADSSQFIWNVTDPYLIN